MILDYSSYITETGTKGLVNYVTADTNVSIFKHDATCPFCHKIITNKVVEKRKTETPDWLDGRFDQFEMVIQCPECGWWEYKYSNQSDAILSGIRASEVRYSSAILKSYDTQSLEVPIAALKEHLSKHPDTIYKIDAHKMEDLVRSVLSDFYPSCKVKTFGKTRDGGRDGLLIEEGGKHFFISVKRRESASVTESVSTLRDLIGATIIEDKVDGCIVVSTADHFSKDAKKYASTVVEKKYIETFDLIDCKEFLRMTDLSREKMPTAWEKLLQL